MKPIIYLDVDGVLNFDDKNAFSFDKKVYFSDTEYYIVRLDRRHGHWLTDLAQKSGAELIWATTWMEHANDKIGAEIGLPLLPYVDFGPRKFTMSSGTWKALGVIEHHDNRPFLWFDDDFTIPGILEHEVTVPHKVHLIGGAGITEQDIESAYQWLSDL